MLELDSQVFTTGVGSENTTDWEKFSEISNDIFNRSSDFFNYYIIYLLGYGLPEKYRLLVEKSYAATVNVASSDTILTLTENDDNLKNQEDNVDSMNEGNNVCSNTNELSAGNEIVNVEPTVEMELLSS